MYANIYPMKRTTVYLEEETDLEFGRLARQQDRPKAELIREALKAYISRAQTPRKLPRSVGIVSVGMVNSGGNDFAERAEELYGELLEAEHEEIMRDWKERKQRDSSG